jgi:CDP-diacylglycerol--glycerol-3-phosphate 3-phosphatidyltransferase
MISNMSAIPAWKKQLPMWLTWSRIAVCPFMVACLLTGNLTYHWIAAAIFIDASITDWFDGTLARKYQAESNLGRFMDPIADKILVASALIMLIPTGRADPIMVLLLLVRDIFIGGIRSVAAADGVVISAKAAGKWKTGLQMVGVPALLVGTSVFGFPMVDAGRYLLWASVVLSMISGVDYFRLYLQSRKHA